MLLLFHVSYRSIKGNNIQQLLADAASIDSSFMYALDDLDAEVEIFNFLIAATYECNDKGYINGYKCSSLSVRFCQQEMLSKEFM
jgi:hypothetical protein